MTEHKCTLCNHYSKTDEQNERHEATDAHRIAELEAQNKRLEAYLRTILIIPAVRDLEANYPYSPNPYTDARALLAELSA